jgi:hypothetical protein
MRVGTIGRISITFLVMSIIAVTLCALFSTAAPEKDSSGLFGSVTTNIKTAIDLCRQAAEVQFKGVRYLHYETTIGEVKSVKRMAVVWVHSRIRDDETRADYALLCTWDLPKGSTTWLWNGPMLPLNMSFANAARDGDITCPVGANWNNLPQCEWSVKVFGVGPLANRAAR